MIYEKLFDWQKRIVDKFKDRESFGLFLDMGLGKTPLSLAMAEANNCTKVIVITINSKATEDETVNGSFLWWAKQSSIDYTLHTKWSSAAFEGNDILLINYESLFSRKRDRAQKVMLKPRIEEFINSCIGHKVAILIDESHKMKNLQSMQTKAIFLLRNKLIVKSEFVHSYLLTGTPFTTGYIDLYTQLKMLGYEGNKGDFMNRFCEMGNLPGLLGWQQPIVGYKNVDKLYELVHRYAITIKSEEVIDLPEQIFIRHPLSQSKAFDMFTSEFVSGEDVMSYNNTREDKLNDTSRYMTKNKVNNPYFRNIAYPSLDWLADTSGTFWLRARQLSTGFQGNAATSKWFDRTRLDAVKAFLENNVDNYVLFYNFTPELIELYDICEELGYDIDVYCGEIKSLIFYEKYQRQSEAERMSNKKNIILANFASGSTGKNWQLYNKCIIFSMPVYKDWEQGIKRVHRLGQTKTVFYHLFYQKNWLDWSMKKSLETSTEYTQQMFDADLQRISQIIENSND